VLTLTDDNTIDIDISDLVDLKVNTLELDNDNKALVITLVNGDKINADVTELYDNINVKDLSIDSDNKDLVVTLTDDSVIRTDIAELYDNVQLDKLEIDSDNKKLIATLTDDSTVELDISELYDNVQLSKMELLDNNETIRATLTDNTTIDLDISNIVNTPVAGLNKPKDYKDEYWFLWDKQYTNDSSVFTTQEDGIKVLKDGVYKVSYYQRAKDSDSDYGAIAISGDRDTLQGRENGIWIHDHSKASTTSFSTSFYIGELYADELITAGYRYDGDGYEGGAEWGGALYIERLANI
jgi:hypothetical protein